MTKLEKYQLKAQKSIDFLDQHPAICGSINPVFSAIGFSIVRSCKRGFSEPYKRGIQISIRSKLAKKFKSEFKKELERLKKGPDDYNIQKHFATIWKTYEQCFGEPWKFDHVDFWGRISFFVFHGKNTKIKEEMNMQNWQRYEGFDVTARTFEEMINKFEKKFKKIFGNFDGDSFKTKEEISNNRKHRPFLFTKKHTLDNNPKYMRVSDAEINRRWLKWFVKTDYAKKYWKGTFKEPNKNHVKIVNKLISTKKGRKKLAHAMTNMVTKKKKKNDKRS